MRIPFVPRDVAIYQDRYQFIKEYRGGGFIQIASSVYWLLAFAITYFLSEENIIKFYILGGFMIPLLSFMLSRFFKLQFSESQYSSLVGFASAITVFCFPVLLLIRDLNPAMVLPVLCIISSAHLIILGWVHLEYLYMLKAAIGTCFGMTFIFSLPEEYAHFIALVYGVITLVMGVMIHLGSKYPLKGYDVQIIDK